MYYYSDIFVAQYLLYTLDKQIINSVERQVEIIYSFRMGSFTSKPKLAAEENADLEIDFPPTTLQQLLAR